MLLFFFFCTLHLRPSNLEVIYLTQTTDGLNIFTNLEIGIFFAVQEKSRHAFNKLQVQKRFRISSFYDPFYCNMICFSAVF